jgi:peptidyl-dipeptidase A
MKQALLLAAACVGIMCGGGSSGAPPSAADAETFLDTVNDTMKRLGIEQGRAGWVQQTFITDDTEALATRANQLAIDAAAHFAKDAVKFDKVDVPADQRRQLNLLKVGLVMATSSDPKESEELTKTTARLESASGRANGAPARTSPTRARRSTT